MSVLNKKGLIVILIYFVIAFTVTTYLVYISNRSDTKVDQLSNNNNETGLYISKEGKVISSDSSDLHDKYSVNNIRFVKEDYLDGVKLDEPVYPYDILYNSFIEYTKVDGLKDKTIENNINTKIKAKVDGIVNHINSQNKASDMNSYTVTCYETYNAANILSITITGDVSLKTDNEDDYESNNYIDTITLNLVTGEEIKFEDLFTDNAPIKSIIRHAVYRTEAENIYDKKIAEIYEQKENESIEYDINSGSFNDVDYSEVENVVFKKMSLYNDSGVKSFSIYNTFVSLNLSDGYDNYNSYYIDFNDYYEYIKLNNIAGARRGIYEKGDLPIENFVYTYPHFTYSLFNGKLSKNSYLIVLDYNINDYSINGEYDRITKLRNTRYVKNFVNSFRKFHDLNNDPEHYYFYVANLSNQLGENDEFIIDDFTYNLYVDAGIYKSGSYEEFESDMDDSIIDYSLRLGDEINSLVSFSALMYYREYENNPLLLPNLVDSLYTNFGLDADGNIVNYDKIHATVNNLSYDPRITEDEEERNTTIIPTMDDSSPASLAPELDNNYDTDGENNTENNDNNSNNQNNNPNYQYMTIVTEYSSSNQETNEINNNTINQDTNQVTNQVTNTTTNTITNTVTNQVYNNITQ